MAPPAKRPRRLCANDVIALKRMGLEEVPARPAFMHQLFPDEALPESCEAPPAVTLEWTPASVHYRVRMTGGADDVRKALEDGLKNVVEDFEAEPMAFEPPGVQIEVFDVASRRFEIYSVRGGPSLDKRTAAYHDRVQKLAYFWIETADDIRLDDPRWEVQYLYDTADPWTLVGYTTLFHFNNPVRGRVTRICQTLVLPWYQRQGHGRRLLELAQRRALQDPSTVLLTVEDPCVGFSRLRDAVDVGLVVRRLSRDDSPFPGVARALASARARQPLADDSQDENAAPEMPHGSAISEPLAALALALVSARRDAVETLAADLKLTPAQSRVSLDAVAFFLHDHLREVQEKPLRLAAKRRFHALFRQELDELQRHTDRVAFLQDKYVGLRYRCRGMVKAIRR